MTLTNGDPLLDRIDALSGWFATTPGASNGGRVVGTDDPDRLGWDVIERHLREDGVVTFRHVPVSAVDDIAARVAAWGFTLHSWRVFHGAAAAIPTRRRPAPPQAGHVIAVETRPPDATVSEAMAFLRAHGIRPFTARILAGRSGPSVLATARSAEGALAAVAFGHFCFNAHSLWHGTAWCGLVAVNPAARKAGLGRAVNDAVVDAMIARHGAAAVVEYAAEDNLPSRRMIEGSGLVLRDNVVSCAATAGATRFTR